MIDLLERQIQITDGSIHSLKAVLKELKIATESQFLTDFDTQLTLNGAKSNRAVWNLICSRRDVRLWQVGMKPNRHWKITDVKNYFGIKGNKDVIVEKIEYLCEMFLPSKE